MDFTSFKTVFAASREPSLPEPPEAPIDQPPDPAEPSGNRGSQRDEIQQSRSWWRCAFSTRRSKKEHTNNVTKLLFCIRTENDSGEVTFVCHKTFLAQNPGVVSVRVNSSNC